MIYLHKILPALILPTGLTIFLVMAGILFRKRGLCWAGVGLLWITSLPVIGTNAIRLVEGWQVRKPMTEIRRADAIVVLSNRPITPPGDVSVVEWNDDIDRFEGGLALFRAGKAPRLILTGGWLPWWGSTHSAGEVLAILAVRSGIPRESLFITGKAMSTASEAVQVARLLRDGSGISSRPTIILVTSAYHMRRSQFLFESVGTTVVSFPVDFQTPAGDRFSILDLIPNASSLRHTEMALREMYGYLYAHLMSWVGVAVPVPSTS